MAVIITDGKSNNKTLTLSEAQLLRNNGVIIFSVGVGDGVDTSELQGMATKTSYMFDVSTFDALNSIRDNLAKPQCKVISCGHPDTPNNGYLHGSDFSQGKSVIYSCKSGYKLVGNQRRTCQRDSIWSGNLPSCIFVNMCNSSPCQNGGSCVDGEDRYTCNCIHGYTGGHCEKDIHPPIKMYCPSEIQRDSSSPLVNITWTAPDFYDPFGHNLEVTSNYPNHGSIFIWGNYTAQYTALKPFNGLRVYRIFDITIKLGVNKCNRNPCQNGGSCIGDRNKYICNCIHGSTGVHCEKDIQPPVNKFCPSNIRQFSSSRYAKVTWRAPDFYDPFGHDVEVTSNYPNHGSIFFWGDYTVQYTALKRFNGLTANCTFSIIYRPKPCPNISAPLNGALVCNGWKKDLVRVCIVFCQRGTRPSPDHDLRMKHFCAAGGHWMPKELPSCERSSLEPPERDAFHYFMSCDKKHIDRMKKYYINILRNSMLRILCFKFKDLCKPENVDVQCSHIQVNEMI